MRSWSAVPAAPTTGDDPRGRNWWPVAKNRWTDGFTPARSRRRPVAHFPSGTNAASDSGARSQTRLGARSGVVPTLTRATCAGESRLDSEGSSSVGMLQRASERAVRISESNWMNRMAIRPMMFRPATPSAPAAGHATLPIVLSQEEYTRADQMRQVEFSCREIIEVKRRGLHSDDDRVGRAFGRTLARDPAGWIAN